MTVNQLVLCPADPSHALEGKRELLYSLEQAGFIGVPLMLDGQQHYRPGDRFLQLLTFLGCSPVVSLGEPGATGEEYCHIRLDGPYDQAQFLAGSNVKTPRCPGCGFRIDAWPDLVAQWNAAPTQPWRCPLCGKQYQIPQLRWRQCAGFGRFFVRVWGVFEGEAVPADELMKLLREVSGFDWQYFYLREG